MRGGRRPPCCDVTLCLWDWMSRVASFSLDPVFCTICIFPVFLQNKINTLRQPMYECLLRLSPFTSLRTVLSGIWERSNLSLLCLSWRDNGSGAERGRFWPEVWPKSCVCVDTCFNIKYVTSVKSSAQTQAAGTLNPCVFLSRGCVCVCVWCSELWHQHLTSRAPETTGLTQSWLFMHKHSSVLIWAAHFCNKPSTMS